MRNHRRTGMPRGRPPAQDASEYEDPDLNRDMAYSFTEDVVTVHSYDEDDIAAMDELRVLAAKLGFKLHMRYADQANKRARWTYNRVHLSDLRGYIGTNPWVTVNEITTALYLPDPRLGASSAEQRNAKSKCTVALWKLKNEGVIKEVIDDMGIRHYASLRVYDEYQALPVEEREKLQFKWINRMVPK